MISLVPAGGEYGDIEQEGSYQATATLWVLGNYSRFIRPGYRRIALDLNESRTFFGSAWLSPEGDKVVAVYTNMSDKAVRLGETHVGWSNEAKSIATYTTTGSKNLVEGTVAAGKQVILEANPDYYGDAPKMRQVTILFMEEDAAFAAVRAGQVDVAYTGGVLWQDQSVPEFSLLDCETVDNRGFNLPAVPETVREDGVKIGNDFTADVQVRRAINLAIDRDEMIEHVLNGYGTAAYSVCDRMPWYNEAAEVDYDPDMAAAILKEAGWLAGSDGILEKNGVRAEFNMLYPTGDSVRQALAEDTANQLKEIGIKVTTEGVGWDTAYDRAQSTPLMWGWGAHTPMELYNIYHTAPGKQYAEYSPYGNER